jgi:hypothetical protein
MTTRNDRIERAQHLKDGLARCRKYIPHTSDLLQQYIQDCQTIDEIMLKLASLSKGKNREMIVELKGLSANIDTINEQQDTNDISDIFSALRMG